MPNKTLWQEYCWQNVAQGPMSYQFWELGEVNGAGHDPEDHTSGPAAAVIALHGWLDNSASFTPMLEHLLSQSDLTRVNVYALDFAGHGHSFHRPQGCFYTIWDYAIDVVQFIQAKELHEVWLLGHSMGACVAPLIAAMLPAKVQGICAIEGLGPVTTVASETPRQLQKAIVRQGQQQQRASNVFATAEDALLARLGSKMTLQEPAARLLVERNLLAKEGGFVWRSDRRVTLPSPVRYSEDQIWAVLDGLSMPVTLVVGDALQQDVGLSKRAKRIPHIQWRRLSGGHHLHMENQVSACADAIIELLTINS